MSKGILLGDDDDLKITVRRDSSGMITGGLTIGERTIQDAYIVLKSNQGEVKEDPLCGANLVRNIRAKANQEKIRKTIEVSLKRVGIDFEDVKDRISAKVNKESI